MWRKVGNEREEMVEGPFIFSKRGPNWDLSQNWLAGMRVELPRTKLKE